MFVLKGHTRKIGDGAIAFSSEGRYLVSGSEDKTARVWDLVEQKCVGVLKPHGALVTGVGFIRDGSAIVTGSWDRKVRIWNAETFKREKTIGDGHLVCYLTVAPKGKLYDEMIGAVGGDAIPLDGENPVWMWEANSLYRLAPWEVGYDQIGALAFSPDQRWVATGDSACVVTVFDRTTAEIVCRLKQRGWIQSLCFSPDSSLLASAGGRRVHVWPTKELTRKGKPKPVAVLSGFRDTVYSALFTPDGERIIVGSKDGSVRIWNRRLNKWEKDYRWKVGEIRALAVSPDGMTAALGSESGVIMVWDLE